MDKIILNKNKLIEIQASRKADRIMMAPVQAPAQNRIEAIKKGRSLRRVTARISK